MNAGVFSEPGDKGRDFFDLGMSLEQLSVDVDELIICFQKYTEFEGRKISRAEFEKNLYHKLTDKRYLSDINFLLPTKFNYLSKINHHAHIIYNKIVTKLPGQAWKGDFERCLRNEGQMA